FFFVVRANVVALRLQRRIVKIIGIRQVLNTWHGTDRLECVLVQSGVVGLKSYVTARTKQPPIHVEEVRIRQPPLNIPLAWTGIRKDEPDIGDLSFFKKALDRKSTRLNSSHVKISYAVFCLKKKNTTP